MIDVEIDHPNSYYDDMSFGELLEIIDKAEDYLLTLDKRTKSYKYYVNYLNRLFDIYNKRKGEKIYKLIKIN